MDRLGSGVRISDSFQIFALTAGKCFRWEGNCPGGGNVRGEYIRGPRGEMSYTPVIKQCDLTPAKGAYQTRWEDKLSGRGNCLGESIRGDYIHGQCPTLDTGGSAWQDVRPRNVGGGHVAQLADRDRRSNSPPDKLPQESFLLPKHRTQREFFRKTH